MNSNRTLLTPPEWKEWIERYVCAADNDTRAGYTYEECLRDIRYKDCYEIALLVYSRGICVHPETVNQNLPTFKLWRAGVLDDGDLMRRVGIHRHGEKPEGKEG